MELTKLNSKFPNKCAFITGAGSGLGTAFAKLLAANHWTLHLSDINEATLSETSELLAHQTTVYTYILDVSNRNQYEQVHQKVIRNSPQIDLVINNAGIGDAALFKEYTLANWEKMIHINLLGTFYGCHFFTPTLLSQQSGLIINVGSAAGFMNSPGASAYNVSKAGVFSLSETLYHELKPHNVHVSVVTPTFFKTNLMDGANGSKRLKNSAEKQMKHSKTNAHKVAATALIEAAKGTFQIIHPSNAKRMYFLKKWFPSFINKQYKKMMEKIS
ncbi:SDR family NAD(P)-dependent oxidoreductase [Tenacibaculum amylolyticum]|uniref:SDR family NAD(P)-dependent oxidoreductase n=1 Tax=Tenacibaculum amylolyticum TaxID=104269 RepID=UPI003893E787